MTVLSRPSVVAALSVGAALASALWIAIGFAVDRDRNGARTRAELQATNLARAFEEHVARTVTDINRALLHVRQEYTEDRQHFETRAKVLQDGIYSDLIFQIGIIDRDGILTYSTLTPWTASDLSDREHFKVHQQSATDALFISKPIFGRVSGKWSIQFTRKIMTKHGAFDGVAVFSIDPEYFRKFYESVDVGAEGVVALVGMDRVPRAWASRVQAMRMPADAVLPDLPAFAPASPGVGIHTAPSGIDDIVHIGAYRRLTDYPLVVLVLLPEREVYAASDERRRNLMLGGGILTVLLLGGSGIIGWLIGKQIAARRALAASEERLRLALEAVGDGVWDWNIVTGQVHYSHGWKAMLGYRDDDISPSLDEWKRRVHPDDLVRSLASVQAHLAGRSAEYLNEHRILCKDGSYRWILARGVVVGRAPDGSVQRLVGTHLDITDRKDLEAKLAAQAARMSVLATTDALTGVANRRRFYEAAAAEIGRAVRYGRALSLVMLDIDHFKLVNDEHGHGIGDEVLKAIAGVCNSLLRQQDLLGRLGGEEFAVMLPDTDLPHAAAVAEKLRAAIERTAVPLVGGASLRVTASFGIATLEPGDTSVESILGRADQLLYEAKQAGRNRVAAPCAERGSISEHLDPA